MRAGFNLGPGLWGGIVVQLVAVLCFYRVYEIIEIEKVRVALRPIPMRHWIYGPWLLAIGILLLVISMILFQVFEINSESER